MRTPDHLPWTQTQIQLYTDDMNAANSYENPNAVVPSVNSAARLEGGKVTTVAKKLSWNVFRFKKRLQEKKD